MATPFQFMRSLFTSSKHLVLPTRIVAAKRKVKWKKSLFLFTCASAGLSYFYYKFKEIKSLNNSREGITAYIKAIKTKNLDNSLSSRLTKREKLFVNFASVELNGKIYMTPQDFLESIIKAEPKPRLNVKNLNSKNMEEIKAITPSIKLNTNHTFRNLGDKGIISYMEYLFLLSILTKPSAGFEIAFKMLDTGRNQKVDIKEFCVLLATVCAKVFKENILKGVDPAILEKTLSRNFKLPVILKPRNFKQTESSQTDKAESIDHATFLTDILRDETIATTTLLLHFFGKDGKELIDFNQFARFMVNLQTEVLELEFLEFSSDQKTITELDFARILLRYSNISESKYEKLLKRLEQSKYEKKGITFEEFRNFFTFLNNINDFGKVLKMYTLAKRPISESEFQRAVRISADIALTQHVIHTIFVIFDEEGDGKLTYNEFIAVMKDRLHRGLHQTRRPSGWKGFKLCVRQKMKRTI